LTERANGRGGSKSEEGKQDSATPAKTPTQTTPVNRDIVTPANATTTKGSSSTTTGANVQSVAGVSSPDYSNLYSANPLTQGANRGTARGAGNASLTARASSDSTLANPTNLSSPVNVNFHNVEYSQANLNQYPMLIQRSPYVQQTVLTQSIIPATNTDNQYLQTENAAVRTAQQRQNKFVDNNKFRAISLPHPSAPTPTKIYTRTNLLKQAGQDSNPLSILEGNPFVAPQQQYFVQLNEEFAPRPQLQSFTTDPYIGVHKRSPLAPNADNEQNQRKGVMDYAIEIRQHKYFPVLVVGLAIIVLVSVIKGTKPRGI
jgi:hypothetical protein